MSDARVELTLPHVAGAPAGPQVPRRFYAVALALAALLVAVAATDARPAWVTLAVTGAVMAWATHRVLLSWRAMVSAIVLCVLLVASARYSLPVNLPFSLDPYRALVLGTGVAWLGSMLIRDGGIRLERSSLGGPIALILFSLVVSILANLESIQQRGLVTTPVVFKLSFFVSFFVVMAFVGSAIRDRADLDWIVKVLVGGGAVVAFFTIVQNRTGYNAFDHLNQVFPALRLNADQIPADLEPRGAGYRVYASAQHPIALGAALAMLVPPGVYLGFRTGRRLWWAAVALICLATLITVARTAVLMLFVEALVLLVLKPHIMRRIWWAIPPFLVVVNLAAPATLGTLKSSFFPEGGLVEQQSSSPGGDASNRVADIGPSLEEASATPFFGQGAGTRRPEDVDPSKSNRFLDNQWLGNLLETGALGVLAWLWFFGRSIRLLGRSARRDETDDGWLFAGLAASVTGFAVGMFTYDAFGFTQATTIVFILLGIGVAARRILHPDGPELRPVPTPGVPAAGRPRAAVAIAARR